ncbi:MAG: hypothetical protein F4Y18_01955 [Cenarchaeum sp. SB0663_bin_5]|nr:hypothetical protein [Cenarchaeum sp. SB0663_bin_5]MYL10986.1 hypothetical protein [Cenarchaeum sp. SB0669_bin_11]
MPETKAVTLRLEPGLYDRLNTQAGTTPISRHITTILEKSQNDNSVSLSISPDMAKQIDALIPPGAQHLTRAALVEYVLSLYFAQRDKTPQLVDVTPTAQPNNRPTITTRIKQRFKL